MNLTKVINKHILFMLVLVIIIILHYTVPFLAFSSECFFMSKNLGLSGQKAIRSICSAQKHVGSAKRNGQRPCVPRSCSNPAIVASIIAKLCMIWQTKANVALTSGTQDSMT